MTECTWRGTRVGVHVAWCMCWSVRVCDDDDGYIGSLPASPPDCTSVMKMQPTFLGSVSCFRAKHANFNLRDTRRYHSCNMPPVQIPHATGSVSTCHQISFHMPPIQIPHVPPVQFPHATSSVSTCHQFSFHMPPVQFPHATGSVSTCATDSVATKSQKTHTPSHVRTLSHVRMLSHVRTLSHVHNPVCEIKCARSSRNRKKLQGAPDRKPVLFGDSHNVNLAVGRGVAVHHRQVNSTAPRLEERPRDAHLRFLPTLCMQALPLVRSVGETRPGRMETVFQHRATVSHRAGKRHVKERVARRLEGMAVE
jgi:hypothetical protein